MEKNNDKTNVIAISDMHGRVALHDLANEIRKCRREDMDNLLLVAGDIIPLDIQRSEHMSREYLKQDFTDFIKSVGCDGVAIVAGNHDLFFESNSGEVNDLIKWFPANTFYLENDFCCVCGLIVIGTPLCSQFGHWAFMSPENEQKEIIGKLISDVKHKYGNTPTIVLAHDAPYSVSDVCLEHFDRKSVGNRALNPLVDELQPQWFIHGHLHSSDHGIEYITGKAENGNYIWKDIEPEKYTTACVNVSIIDEAYQRKFKPFCFVTDKQFK